MNTRYNLRSGRVIYAPIYRLRKADVVKFIQAGDKHKGKRGIIYCVTPSRVHVHIELNPDEKCMRSPNSVIKIGHAGVFSSLPSSSLSDSTHLSGAFIVF